MKFEVHTIIQARIVVEANSETEAFDKAESEALAVVASRLETRGKIITAAREADEITA
jgi:hypothetical protein